MLNLLPPEVKQRQKARSHLYIFTVTYLVVVAGLILGSLGLATLNLTRKSAISELKTRIESYASQRQRNEDLVLKAAFLEDRLRSSSTYQEKKSWDAVLDEVASSTPTNVTLSSLRVDTNGVTPKISVNGETNDRRAIILFRDKLADSTLFGVSSIQAMADVVSAGGVKTFTFSIDVLLEKNTDV